MIFGYLDSIVINHNVNEIPDLIGSYGENKYNCFVLSIRLFRCLIFGEAFDPSWRSSLVL